MQCTVPWMLINGLLFRIGQWHLETARHSLMVSTIALELGLKIGINKDGLTNLYVGSLLHDIGKMAVPELILDKPYKLSNREFELIKHHPNFGYRLLAPFEFPQEVISVVMSHHERYDGSGYPLGLKGESIPLLVRICAVADAFEVMTSGRPYRDKLPIPLALAEIENCRGQQFDPNVVDVLQRMDIEKTLLANTYRVNQLQEAFDSNLDFAENMIANNLAEMSL